VIRTMHAEPDPTLNFQEIMIIESEVYFSVLVPNCA
jgi:hypothetical protein